MLPPGDTNRPRRCGILDLALTETSLLLHASVLLHVFSCLKVHYAMSPGCLQASQSAQSQQLTPACACCRKEGDVEVAINPEELEGLDDAAVQALYRQRLAQQQTGQQREVGCPACASSTVLGQVQPARHYCCC